MREDWWNDDEELFVRLRDAYREGTVPQSFVRTGKAVFVPADVDAELAALTFDSFREPALTRADTATLRSLVFEGPRTTIELEVLSDGLLGQVVPAAVVRVDLVVEGHTVATVHSDHLGCFRFDAVPRDRFRLHCRGPSGMDVVTSWTFV